VLQVNNRAFKEWAVACDAMRDGRQILLIRKGGIREEGGVFTMTDREFFLLPTFEHQNASLLQPEFLPRLEARRHAQDPAAVTIDTYAVVDTILTARDEGQVNSVSHEIIWNTEYVKQRFDFNPYDPLYLVVLRAYRLARPVTLALLQEYIGCRSWVTLNRSIPTQDVVPSVPDADFLSRRERLLATLQA
jgi:hypothetical protein